MRTVGAHRRGGFGVEGAVVKNARANQRRRARCARYAPIGAVGKNVRLAGISLSSSRVLSAPMYDLRLFLCRH